MRMRSVGKRVVRFINSSQDWVEIRRKGKCDPVGDARAAVARLYIHGEGLEIGPLCRPLSLPAGTRARYVDRLSTAQLRDTYPGLNPVKVDIVEDAERLPTIPEASQDFIVANHFLEHCEDPIRALQTMASRIKPGGVLFIAVPDADLTFDRDRRSTAYAHLMKDYTGGPLQSRAEHYREWVSVVEGLEAVAAENRTRALLDTNYSVHFHVWRWLELVESLDRCIDEMKLALSFEMVMRYANEVICVLRKTAEPHGH
jgi:predicted SAM-dependent methyltransferase